MYQERSRQAYASPDDVLRQFRVIFRSVKRHFLAVEKQCGLSGSQLWALAIVHREPGLRVTELAARLSIHQSTASNLVENLSRKGLIERRRNDQDLRVVRLHATPEGAARVGAAPQPLEGLLPDALRHLDAQTLSALHGSMTSLLGVMKVRDESAILSPLADI
jgi:DNA-binding MarR family transcriptional regulator